MFLFLTLWVEQILDWYRRESPTILLRVVPKLFRGGPGQSGPESVFDQLVKATRIEAGPGVLFDQMVNSGGGALGPVGSEPPARRERRGSRNARSRGREDVAGITIPYQRPG